MPRPHANPWTAHCAPCAVAFTVALLISFAAFSPAGPGRFPDRSPLGHTGGFGEPTCSRCHAGSAINSASGALTLQGLPAAYEPAQRYRLVVNLDHRGVRRAGFQLAIRFNKGEAAGQAAGGVRALDDRVQLADSLGVRYAFHTSAGSAITAPNQAVWFLEWTAPRDGGRVVAHFVASATNDDASELGDLVYADSAVSDPAR